MYVYDCMSEMVKVVKHKGSTITHVPAATSCDVMAGSMMDISEGFAANC